VRGNDLWVGEFARSGAPRAYPYRVSANGDLQRAGESFRVPTRTQGMAVTDNHFISCRSFGRDNDSRIESFARRTPFAHGPSLTAPNMAEGMVFAGGDIHVLYESGSDEYASPTTACARSTTRRPGGWAAAAERTDGRRRRWAAPAAPVILPAPPRPLARRARRRT